MRIYFYGATLSAAEKKCNTFVKTLRKADEKLSDKDINITRINDPAEADMNCVVKAYKFSVCCEYSIKAKGNK